MKIIKIHYKISKPVKHWKEIKKDAKAMLEFIHSGKFEGFYNKAYAIAHCQVSETPYAFFVAAGECVTNDPKMGWVKMFESQIVINPEIIEAPLHKKIQGDPDALKKMGIDTNQVKASNITVPNAITYQEPCMSFPFRKPKSVIRYDVIKVRYQIKRWWGFKTIETELKGIASEIFQHEYDHTKGKNIYFESENPVEWWNLIGHDKSKGGTSLDNPEGLGLNRAKEKASKDFLTPNSYETMLEPAERARDILRNQELDKQALSIQPPLKAVAYTKYPRTCDICGHHQNDNSDCRCEHQAEKDDPAGDDFTADPMSRSMPLE
jgi:peptide deformylase